VTYDKLVIFFMYSGFLHQKNDRHNITEIPKHAGPTDKSGKNQFGPEKYWFPFQRFQYFPKA
jgi:hypothetical protein